MEKAIGGNFDCTSHPKTAEDEGRRRGREGFRNNANTYSVQTSVRWTVPILKLSRMKTRKGRE